jgi:hypothetical protein
LEDVIQVWVTDGYVLNPFRRICFVDKIRRIYTAEQKERVAKARDIMLGPRNTRGRYRPRDVLDDEKRPTGEKVGGTAYERSSVAVSVKYPARAYTISLSVEAPTAIMAPVASTRISEKYDVEDRLQLDARNQLLRVSSIFVSHPKCSQQLVLLGI